jgi:hypothetical protein
MLKFKLGVILGFLAGWAVGSGKAAELVERMRSSSTAGAPGAAGSSVTRPGFDRSSESTAVSA